MEGRQRSERMDGGGNIEEIRQIEMKKVVNGPKGKQKDFELYSEINR